MVIEDTKHTCDGCQSEVYTVEYYTSGIFVGDYCVDCMSCPLCGTDLDVTRLGQMIVAEGLQSELLHIPAKYCPVCIRNGIE